jgi:hypothetical protein
MDVGSAEPSREREIVLSIELLAFDDDYSMFVQVVDNLSNRTGVESLAQVQTLDLHPKRRLFNGFELHGVPRN